MQMQTPKASTKSTLEGSRKISPRSVSSDPTHRSSGQAARHVKATGPEANSSSPNQPSVRIRKSISPKVSDRRSPRSPISEKKRPGRVAELETQISQLQDALKTVKDQLVSSESWKDQAQQDAQESRKQLLALSSKLDESQKHLPQSSSEEPHGIQPLQDMSEVRDEAWKSKLEAAKKLHSAELDALGAAMNEIDQLKVKLNAKAKSEAEQTKQAESAYAEVQSLKETMVKTLSLVEDMKNEIKDCKSSDSRAQALARDTLLELETAKKTIESLKLDGKDVEGYDAIGLELDKSRECESEIRHEEDIIALKSEVRKLKSAERRFNEEQSRSTMEITSAYELVEEIKFNSRVKESELENKLKKSKMDIEELKATLMDKETELQGICEENEDLNTKLENSLSGKRENELEKEIKSLKQDFDFLKSKLMGTETELRDKSDENEQLKLEIKKTDRKEPLASECESIVKVDHLVEEIGKSNKKVARVAEQLEAAQASNCEMEAELRKLKVQSDQWQKAAEAAAAMLSTGNNKNGRLMERTGSMDNHSPGRKIGTRYGEDIDDDEDDEFLKKKNRNVLGRIGVLWKKPQNKRP